MDSIFKNCKINTKRLEAFGFKHSGGNHVWTTPILDGRFTMTVTITRGNKVTTRIVDAATGEDYALYQIPDAVGEFVGRVRAARDAVLAKIRAACCDERPFTGDDANRLCAYAAEQFGDKPEFLWKQYPGYAVLRRTATGKWYAVIMTVPRVKLDLAGDQSVEIVDVHIDPKAPAAVPDGKRFFPGYHMNKKCWLTILLDGTVPFKEIAALLATSHALANSK